MSATPNSNKTKPAALVEGPELTPTPYLIKLMEEAEADYAADRNIIHTKGIEEATAYLESLMKK